MDGNVPGDLQLSIEIDYLRQMFEPPGRNFRVELQSCTLFEFQSWVDDSVISDPRVVETIQPEILSGSEAGDHVTVICNGYALRLRYDGVHIALDTGDAITLDELQAGADRYWTEWDNRRPRERR